MDRTKHNIKETDWLGGEKFLQQDQQKRLLNDTHKWQERMFYIGIAAVLILFGIFVVLVQIGLS